MPTLQFQRPFTKTEYRNWNCLPILALSGVSYRYEKTCWIMLSIAARAWVVSLYSDAIEQRYQKWFIIGLDHFPTLSLPLVLATWQPLMYMTLDHFVIHVFEHDHVHWYLLLQQNVKTKWLLIGGGRLQKRTAGVSSEKLSWHIYFIKIIYCM